MCLLMDLLGLIPYSLNAAALYGELPGQQLRALRILVVVPPADLGSVWDPTSTHIVISQTPLHSSDLLNLHVVCIHRRRREIGAVPNFPSMNSVNKTVCLNIEVMHRKTEQAREQTGKSSLSQFIWE